MQTTALAQTLLDELEASEAEREREASRLEERDKEHSREMMNLSTRLSREFQESLSDVLQSDNKEDDGIVFWLRTVSSQQEQILDILAKPPKGKDLQGELEKVLQPLFEQLHEGYEKSNEALLTGIQKCLV